MNMDPEIKTLEEKIDKIGKMSEDTNRIVHGMRNSARLGRLARIVWWLAVFVLSRAIRSSSPISLRTSSPRNLGSWGQGRWETHGFPSPSSTGNSRFPTPFHI